MILQILTGTVLAGGGISSMEVVQDLPGFIPPIPLELNMPGNTETANPDFIPEMLPVVEDTALWTIIFYDDAEFPGFNALEYFAEEVQSSANLHVLALEDTMEDEAYFHYIPPITEIGYPEAWGEMNMGAEETLYQLLSYSKANYPAERYMLAMYDHGGGWMGACIDETSGNDILTMDEIQGSITNAGGVDILAFTAPCVMGALESAYELRDCVDVYIASEELSGYILWMGIMDDIAGILNNSSTLTNQDIGVMIVDLIEYNFAFHSYSDWATMSAVSQEDLNDLVETLDELFTYMEQNVDLLGTIIQTTRDESWTMGGQTGTALDETDLYDFLDLYLEAEEDPFIAEKVQESMTLFETVILNECTGPMQERAHGLSINFPVDEEGSYIEYYGTCNLDFADNTRWNEFLEAYYAWQLSGIGGGTHSQAAVLFPAANPCSGSCEFIYSSPVSGEITVSVSDITGRTVSSYRTGYQTGNSASLTWGEESGSKATVPSGVYFMSVTDMFGQRAVSRVIMIE